MTEFLKQIEKVIEMQVQLKEQQSAMVLKGGTLDDMIKEIAKKHLKVSAEQKEVNLPELLKNAYEAGYRDGKLD